jgi:dipeptidyl aminopeptidase/acylaminoacyl peptidase
LIDRLTKLGKRFEVLPYPGAKHALLRFPDTGRHGWNSVLDFFDRNLGIAAGAAGP